MLKMGSVMLDNVLVHELIIARAYYDRKEKKYLDVLDFNEFIYTLTPEEFNGRFEVSCILQDLQRVYGYPTKNESVDNDGSTARITYTTKKEGVDNDGSTARITCATDNDGSTARITCATDNDSSTARITCVLRI